MALRNNFPYHQVRLYSVIYYSYWYLIIIGLYRVYFKRWPAMLCCFNSGLDPFNGQTVNFIFGNRQIIIRTYVKKANMERCWNNIVLYSRSSLLILLEAFLKSFSKSGFWFYSFISTKKGYQKNNPTYLFLISTLWYLIKQAYNILCDVWN